MQLFANEMNKRNYDMSTAVYVISKRSVGDSE
jgi:hypothetical protein